MPVVIRPRYSPALKRKIEEKKKEGWRQSDIDSYIKGWQQVTTVKLKKNHNSN